MTLASGTRLGPYEIIAPLGSGGMGEVYRARDPRLGRDVAIKAIPDAFAQDPERLARFEREARLLATLNHPNIASIFAVEEQDGSRMLVMELVEGESLAQRQARGPLPVDEAVAVAVQIAAGVEAAHEAGVIHRDLKPGNVMLRPDGTVKVLDFGLARGPEQSGAFRDLSHSPTMTSPATVAGVILGTAAYMSPEQARGRAVDRRADIWAFGVVLFELLTGQRMFEGETVSETLASVMKDEVPWARLPSSVPSRVRRLLERCLTRDPRQRLQSIGEARIALEHAHEPEPGAGVSPSARPAWVAWAAWALLAVLAVLVLVRGLRPVGTPSATTGEYRLEVPYPEGQSRVSMAPALSPDGRWLVVVAADSLKAEHLWLRSMAGFDYRMLKGTEGAAWPFWSPDSRSIGFFANGRMSHIGVQGEVVELIVEGIQGGRGGTWGRDGTILYAPSSNAGIWRVPSTGGTPSAVTRLDTTIVDASHRFPVWLPDGDHFLFALWSNNSRAQAEKCGIYLGSLRGGEPRRVSGDLGSFLVLPSGHIVVARNSNLIALPFDFKSFQLGQPPVAITGEVGFSAGAGVLLASASAAGDIALEPTLARPASDFVWLDRHGVPGRTVGLSVAFRQISLSPDGSRVVGERVDPANGLGEIWTADLVRHTVSRLTRSQNDSYAPVWSPDGARIAFNNRDTGTEDVYVQPASGASAKQRVWGALSVDSDLSDWSGDGRYLLFSGVPRQGSVHRQIWIVDTRSDSARALLQDEFDQSAPKLSPDGRWLAYLSNESGSSELYVRSFPDLARKWQVSTTGAEAPHWRSDGRELLYSSASTRGRSFWSVAVGVAGSNPSFGEPQLMFTLRPDQVEATPTEDHTRFLAVVQSTAAVEPPMRIVLGWRAGRAR